MDSLFAALKMRNDELAEVIRASRRQLAGLPEGKLRVAAKPYGMQYYARVGGKETYLPAKQRGLAVKLAQRDYCEKVLESAQREQKLLKAAMEVRNAGAIEAIWPGLHPGRKALVEPLVLTDEAYAERWSSQDFTPRKISDNDNSYLTERGERVRSKSEKIIADMLFLRGVPYFYEFPLQLTGWGDVYPDFRVLNVRTRREFRLEHFGMMDNTDYMAGFLRKMRMYEQNGYFPGDNLLFTMETSREPLKPETVSELICRFLK
ncbi:MAG: hypothetical protein IKX54_05905 [Lachnospiraceae bacterium]|nr:hypothetical protein [Lachnospiraceae bacterium]